MCNLHFINAEETNIIYHVESSQFFEVSDNLYEKMSKGNLEIFSDTKMKEVLDYLDSQEKVKFTKQVKGERLTRLAFLSTQSCNLKCTYCFADHGLYKENKSIFMSIQVYKDTLDTILSKYPKGIKMVQFFGGEPLLGFEEIKEFVPYCIEKCNERGIVIPAFGVVTNGTVFTKEMNDFFNKYNIPVTISLDGPKKYNDVARISRSGWSVYDKIIESLKWINVDRKYPLLVELTLNKQHVLGYEPGKAAEWMKEMHELGFDGGVVGVVESSLEDIELTEDYKEKYMQMYREITDYWFAEVYGEKPFCNFDIIRMIKTLTKRTVSLSPCGAGVNTLTVTAKGDILPCYILYGCDEFNMGNVSQNDDIKFNSVSKEFLDTESTKPDECKECWMRNICAIWCRGFGFTQRNSISTVSFPRCWTAKALAEAVMLNLTRIQKKPEEYMKFKQSVMRFNEMYKGES